MLGPNLVFILFSKPSFMIYGFVFNLNFAQSADLYALIILVLRNSTIAYLHYRTILNGPTLFFLKLSDPNPTCISHSVPAFNTTLVCHALYCFLFRISLEMVPEGSARLCRSSCPWMHNRVLNGWGKLYVNFQYSKSLYNWGKVGRV